MLAERKALFRFLIIYLFSTMILLGVGEFLYYKISFNKIVENQIDNIKHFIEEELKEKRFIDINATIFIDKLRIKGNLPYIKDDYLIKDSFLYVKYKKTTRRREFEFIVRRELDIKNLQKLKNSLIFFNIFAFLFIVAVAFILGKIFLKPLKDYIFNLENFIRDSTHEINTPLAIINSNIEMLEMKAVKFKELERIKRGVDRINAIFENLKLLYLNEAFKKQKINFKNLILERLEFFDSEIKKKNLDIRLNLEEKEVFISKEEAIRLIDNLLSNAIKYSSFNSDIEVTLNKECFMVKNKGEIKNIKDVTKKFVRENQNEGGFGLGLWIVDNICKKNEFKFKIFSKNKEVIAIVYF